MKLLVSVDLSDVSAAVVKKAAELAKGMSVEVRLLHIAEPEPDFVGYDVGPKYERDALAEKFHKEHSELQSIADGLRDDGLSVKALLVRGPTVETILNEAEKFGADMIVLGSHGRGAMQRLLMGSVSEGVLRETKCPILIVPTR